MGNKDSRINLEIKSKTEKETMMEMVDDVWKRQIVSPLFSIELQLVKIIHSKRRELYENRIKGGHIQLRVVSFMFWVASLNYVLNMLTIESARVTW